MGVATYYDTEVWDVVVANRLAWGHIEPCAECIGYVALLDAEHIGKKVWLQAPGRPWKGPYLDADCARQQDRAGLLASGFVVDVMRETAEEWGMRGPLPGVRVAFEPPRPPPQCYIDMPCDGKW